jgi:hypothetical protein
MRRLTVAWVLVLLALPAVVHAGEARVRALAAGDERLLPDDDGTIPVFPNRLNEHHRIVIQNLAPPGNDIDPGLSDQPEDDDAWGEASWEMWGGTVQWAVNRPTFARLHQDANADSAAEAAHSVIDFGYGNDKWGFLANIGTASTTVPDGSGGFDTERNSMMDLVWGTNFASGMELGVNFSLSSIGAYDQGDQEKSAYRFGADLRNPVDMPLMNHWVLSGHYSKDIKTSPLDSVDAPTELGVNLTLFKYEQAGMMAGGPADDFTYLLAIGIGVTSFDDGQPGSDRGTALELPSVTAGAEYDLTGWLTMRGSVSRTFVFFFQSDNDQSGASDLLATIGAGAHWGRFSLDAVVNNQLLEDGPDFIGGTGPGVANFVSATYSWD